jgi:hypothetical protein
MKFIQKLSLSALTVAARASTQDVFEPADFNVTEALMNNGVNVSAISELARLVVRSSSKGCSIAVRSHSLFCTRLAEHQKVQLS